jgi:hypothetical protein
MVRFKIMEEGLIVDEKLHDGQKVDEKTPHNG